MMKVNSKNRLFYFTRVGIFGFSILNSSVFSKLTLKLTLSCQVLGRFWVDYMIIVSE